MVQGAYWTADLEQIKGWRQDVQANIAMSMKKQQEATPDEFDFGNLEGEDDVSIISVTSEVQQAITRYFSVFGTKVIDFNPDVSPFCALKDFVGNEKATEMLKMAQQKSGTFKLVLFCMTGGERFNFVVNYNNTDGRLLSGCGPVQDITIKNA